MSKTEWMRQYREKNREKYNAYMNEWNKKHRKKIKYTLKDIKEISRQYDKNFKLVMNAYEKGDTINHKKYLGIEKRLESRGMVIRRKLHLKDYEVFNEGNKIAYAV